jgi:hypothetical protein
VSDVPVLPVPPVGVHAYVYGDTPPLVLVPALPLLPPLQLTFVDEVIVIVGDPAFGTFATAVTVHPFASVTVTV